MINQNWQMSDYINYSGFGGRLKMQQYILLFLAGLYLGMETVSNKD